MRGPEGRLPKREPSPEGLGLNSEYELSAVGAALNLGPLAPVSLGEFVTFSIFSFFAPDPMFQIPTRDASS